MEPGFRVNSRQPSHEPLELGRGRSCWVMVRDPSEVPQRAGGGTAPGRAWVSTSSRQRCGHGAHPCRFRGTSWGGGDGPSENLGNSKGLFFRSLSVGGNLLRSNS